MTLAPGSLQWFLKQIETFENEAVPALQAAGDPDALEAARIKFLGDRAGWLKNIQKDLASVPREEKPAAGRAFNEVKTRVQGLFEERAATLSRASSRATVADLTMPARR